ncbi:MAG: hypothetical protein PUH77_06855, partial [Bacteroidales bacterium]|nr:hypothetical protein [Bacteroidales bacterium]MDY5441999.1 hypothetical protein [Candidatus Cryptobacteroides sp.]
VSITLSNGTYTLTMKRKQINRGKKWLVAVLPPTTFVTITNQKCQLYRKRGSAKLQTSKKGMAQGHPPQLSETQQLREGVLQIAERSGPYI